MGSPNKGQPNKLTPVPNSIQFPQGVIDKLPGSV